MSSELRERARSAAIRFKAGWFELGKLLAQVEKDQSFGEWGFKSFDQYCVKELHLKKQAVIKLLASYKFMHKREPARVSNEDTIDFPPLSVVEVLADADERGQLTERDYEDLRTQIFDPKAKVKTLEREVKQRFVPVAAKVERTGDDALKMAMMSAKGLLTRLQQVEGVSSLSIERARAIVAELESLAGPVEAAA